MNVKDLTLAHVKSHLQARVLILSPILPACLKGYVAYLITYISFDTTLFLLL
jgi:hypothetical protein